MMSSNRTCPNCGSVLAGEEPQVCIDCLLSFEGMDRDSVDSTEVVERLSDMIDLFSRDVAAAFKKDPAAVNITEVLTSYPGVQAILLHRLAHFLYELGVPYLPRFLSHVNRSVTQIEIHPGAEIGTDFFIDHGGGVVIGETTEIGDNVTLYQGVTLGGTSLERGKRHPTVGDDVVIGAGATLLGPIRIGDRVKIGANAAVVEDVPPDSVVVGVPARIISRKGEHVHKIDLEHGSLPDPIQDALTHLSQRIRKLELQLEETKKE